MGICWQIGVHPKISVKHLNPYMRASAGRSITGWTIAWDRMWSVILETAAKQRKDREFEDCAAVDSR